MSEITRDDEIETGDRLRVDYDGESIEGEVVREELHKDKVVIESDAGQEYTLFVPEHSFESWMLDEGGADGPSGRSRVTADADSVGRVDDEDEDDDGDEDGDEDGDGPEVMTDGGRDVPHRTDDIYTADSKALTDDGYGVDESDDGVLTVTPGRTRDRVEVDWVCKVLSNLGYEKVHASPSKVVMEYNPDGGQDVPEHIDDETIEAAIESNDDPDHPDAYSVEDVRDLLAAVQRGAEAGWSAHMDHVEDGDAEVVHEDDGVVILSTGPHNSVAEELEYNGSVDVDGIAKSIVTQIHHDLADERCDRNWGTSYPYVIRKPDDFDAGQRYVEAVVNSLQQRGCSPGQAWAYYGVEIRGNSMNNWGLRKGDHDHKNVSGALEKAKQILP